VILRSHYRAEETSLSRFSYQAAINLAQLNLTILIRSLAIHQLFILLYLAERSPADDLERFEVLDAEPGPLQSEELGLLLGMLQPLLLLLLLRETLILEGLLELRQPLLPLDVLRYQIAVIVLQRYLQKAKRDAPIIITYTKLDPPLPAMSSLESST